MGFLISTEVEPTNYIVNNYELGVFYKEMKYVSFKPIVEELRNNNFDIELVRRGAASAYSILGSGIDN